MTSSFFYKARTFATVPDRTLAKTARVFSTLGEPARLKLVERLLKGEWCVSELAEVLGCRANTLTQQLRVLRNEDLVHRRRSAHHILYRLADEHFGSLIENVLAQGKAIIATNSQVGGCGHCGRSLREGEAQQSAMRVGTKTIGRPAPRSSAVPDAALTRIARLFWTLGHPARLRFVERLGTAECAVSALAEALGHCPNALTRASQQLRILRDEGFVLARRSGRYSLYWLADLQILHLVENALRHIAGRIADSPG